MNIRTLVIVGLPALAGAWNSAFGDEAAPIQETLTLAEVIRMGGWLMWALGGMSILGLALILFFLLTLRREQVLPRALLERLLPPLEAGDWPAARAACGRGRSAMASIARAALDYVERTERPRPELIKEIIESEGNRQASLIQQQTQYLLDIGVIAPMIGLLGTVMGMLRAFNSVALDLAKARPMLLAAGVSQALITTVAGLTVAIPALIAYAYFRGRSAQLIARLEGASADVLAHMADGVAS